MTNFIKKDSIPYLTTAQMIEVDRLMNENFKITLIQMMENAGYCLAKLARDRFFGGNCIGKKVIVLSGTGGNGGGAMVSARRLANNGAIVQVWLAKERGEFKGVAAQQLGILHNIRIGILENGHIAEMQSPDLIIDGIIGYSLRGSPRGTAAYCCHLYRPAKNYECIETIYAICVLKQFCKSNNFRYIATRTMSRLKIISVIITFCVTITLFWCGDIECQNGQNQDECMSLACSLFGKHGPTSDNSTDGKTRECSCACHVPSIPSATSNLLPLIIYITAPECPVGDVPCSPRLQVYHPPLTA